MTGSPPARRRPRVVGVVLLVLAAALLIAGLASLSLDDPKVEPIRITGAGEVQQLLGGIEQKGARLGDPEAPVTIDFFNDLSCDPCAEYQLDVVPPLVEKYVRTGDAELVYRHFSMGERDAFVGDFAALAAAQQDRQWQYLELFFINQGEAKRVGATKDLLDSIAGAVLEMDFDQWQEDLKDTGPDDPAIKADNDLAINLRLPAQPAVVVTGPTGSKELDESPSFAEIEAAIREVS